MKSKNIFPLIVLFITFSCTVKVHLPKTDTVSRDKVLQLQQVLLKQYPQTFSATQRIVLTLSGKEYDFIGYLKVSANGDYRALGLGEMAGTFIDFECRDGNVTVLKNPGHMPLNPIISGAAADIRHLFFYTFAVGGVRPLKREGICVLENTVDSLYTQYYEFQADTLRFSSESQQGRTEREVSYEDYKLFENYGRALPSRIIITNKRWKYQLKIDLLDFKNEQN